MGVGYRKSTKKVSRNILIARYEIGSELIQF